MLQSDPHPDKPLVIHTDSKYTISCKQMSRKNAKGKQKNADDCSVGLCEWVGGWLKRDWRNASGKPVENKELIHYTYALFQQRPGPVKVSFIQYYRIYSSDLAPVQVGSWTRRFAWQRDSG